MDVLLSTVVSRTTISEGYVQHAAHESMSSYLADWEHAYDRLGRQIGVLRALREGRKAEQERGEWPPPPLLPAAAEREEGDSR